MAAREIRQMSVGEIHTALEEAKKELFNLRFQREVGQLENPRRVRTVRRQIARYKTVLRELQIAETLVKEEGNKNAE
jgi:large subunit ribosomal protein L29